MHAPEKLLSGHRIRPMEPEDLDEVLAIERRSFPNPWTKEMFLGELRNPVSRSYVVRSFGADGEPVVSAYVVFWIVHGEAHVLDIAVRSDFRRFGLGERLMNFALDVMNDNLVYEVFLEVRTSNDAARTLYRKLGFKESFERKNYYGDEDAIVMTKTLN